MLPIRELHTQDHVLSVPLSCLLRSSNISWADQATPAANKEVQHGYIFCDHLPWEKLYPSTDCPFGDLVVAD